MCAFRLWYPLHIIYAIENLLNISDNGTWIQSHSFSTIRHYHCSWTPASGAGTYLIGGGDVGEWTSDLVKPDGTVEESFRLKHKTV